MRIITFLLIGLLASCASTKNKDAQSTKVNCWDYLGKASAFRSVQEYEKSLIEIEKYSACITSPAMPYYYHKAWTLYEMKQYKETVELITEGLKYQPRYGWAYWRRGLAYKAMGETEKAREDFRASYLISVKYDKNAFYKSLKDLPGADIDFFQAVPEDERRRVESEKNPRGDLILVEENKAQIEKDGVVYILNTFIVAFEQPYYIFVERKDKGEIDFNKALEISKEYIKPRGCTAPLERRYDIDVAVPGKSAVVIGIAC